MGSYVDHSGSHDVIDHMTIRLTVVDFLPSYGWSIATMCLFETIMEIWCLKDNGVTILTFWGHVTLSVTWPFDLRWSTSYGWSIVTMDLSGTVMEILCLKVHVHTHRMRMTDRTTNLLISSNVHYVHLGEDKNWPIDQSINQSAPAGLRRVSSGSRCVQGSDSQTETCVT